jgi:hypothetical protein
LVLTWYQIGVILFTSSGKTTRRSENARTGRVGKWIASKPDTRK